jgi:hypothetical protein
MPPLQGDFEWPVSRTGKKSGTAEDVAPLSLYGRQRRFFLVRRMVRTVLFAGKVFDVLRPKAFLCRYCRKVIVEYSIFI